MTKRQIDKMFKHLKAHGASSSSQLAVLSTLQKAQYTRGLYTLPIFLLFHLTNQSTMLQKYFKMEEI